MGVNSRLNVLLCCALFFPNLSAASKEATQTIQSGAYGFQNNGIIFSFSSGYSIQEYEHGLREQEEKLRRELASSDDRRKTADLKNGNNELKIRRLEKELSETKDKLKDVVASFHEKNRYLSGVYDDLRLAESQIDPQQFSEAIASLQKGNSEQADALLAQVQGLTQPAIDQHALASFERGKLAEQRGDYELAYEYLERAIEINPNNIQYLIWTAETAQSMGRPDDALHWGERAEKILFQKEGDSVKIAKKRTQGPEGSCSAPKQDKPSPGNMWTVELPEGYADHAIQDVVPDQLHKAGARLAILLEAIWP